LCRHKEQHEKARTVKSKEGHGNERKTLYREKTGEETRKVLSLGGRWWRGVNYIKKVA